jgi:FkbM family methyltransferase
MLGFNGQIVSFEPLPENVAKITALSRRDLNWFVQEVALGAEAGSRDFHVVRTASGLTNLSSFLAPLGGYESVTSVETARLDSFSLGSRIFLKIDTQGYDVEVLKGAAGVLDRVVLLQSEVSVTPLYQDAPHYTEALAFYESLGFALLDLTVVNRTPEGIVNEYDCLMVKPGVSSAHTAKYAGRRCKAAR